MNKISLKQVFLLFILLVYPIGLKAQMPATLVETDKVTTKEFHDQINLVGRTEAHIESKIVAEVSGRIERINAGEGVWIQQGSPLVTIDSKQIGYLLQAKEAQAEQARLQTELAKTILQRNERLFSQQLISESTIDSVRAWVGITEAAYQEIAADRDRLRQDFENCVIRAPYSGYTGELLTNIGEWVNPGDPIFEMVELSLIKIKVDLPERYFGHLSIGSAVNVAVSGMESTVLYGRVSGIAPNASPETHTFPVIVEVINEKGRLGGGMLVRTTLSLDDQFSSLAVSKDAIIRQGMNTMVYTIVDGKASPVPVELTSTDGKMVAVKSETLVEGMEVVVRGNERIYPGSPVRVGGVPPGAPGQGNPDQKSES